jgi:hypothetical protein
MHGSQVATAEGFVASETTGMDLQDRRLDARARTILMAAASAPGCSFPEMCASDSALEATYRFLGNERVTSAAILDPHFRATAKRVLEAKRVVIAHDSTEFSFGSVPRGDLGHVGRGKSYGFNVHVGLAVTRDETRLPLGVVAVNPYNRTFGSPRLPNSRNKGKASNITHRWSAQVRQVRARLGEDCDIVHVMDREADDYASLAAMVEDDERFVVRQQSDRRLKRSSGEVKTRSVVGETPLIATREVMLSARRKPTKKAYTKQRHPLRKRRLAVLEIRVARITVQRTLNAGRGVPDELTLNLVEIVEKTPPPGVEPVEWWLWTNEPVDTEDQILGVVDAYCARWTIEEFFKALKTGCRYEQRQLESRHALENALAIFTPIAWRLLLLRTLARQAPELSDATALTPLQLLALRGYMKKKLNVELPAKLTAQETMLAVAKLGGHITNNGDPGWLVLGRGLDRLLDIELGLSLNENLHIPR